MNIFYQILGFDVYLYNLYKYISHPFSQKLIRYPTNIKQSRNKSKRKVK